MLSRDATTTAEVQPDTQACFRELGRAQRRLLRRQSASLVGCPAPFCSTIQYVLDVNKTRHQRHNPVLHLSLLVSASVSLSALPRSTVRTDGCRWKFGFNDLALALPVGPFGIARRSPDRRRRCHMSTAPPIARGTHDPLSWFRAIPQEPAVSRSDFYSCSYTDNVVYQDAHGWIDIRAQGSTRLCFA